MKKSLAVLLLSIGIFSCKEEKLVVVPSRNQFTGTKWSSYQTNLPDGRRIYKIVQFEKPDVVKIDYRIDKIYLHYSIGEFTYLTTGDKIWVRNPDNTIAPGEIVDNQFVFGGEHFAQEK